MLHCGRSQSLVMLENVETANKYGSDVKPDGGHYVDRLS